MNNLDPKEHITTEESAPTSDSGRLMPEQLIGTRHPALIRLGANIKDHREELINYSRMHNRHNRSHTRSR